MPVISVKINRGTVCLVIVALKLSEYIQPRTSSKRAAHEQTVWFVGVKIILGGNN